MGRGLGWVLGLLAPARPVPPSASRCIGTCGRGGGGERTAKVDLGDGPSPPPLPPAPGVARDWDSLCSPLAPGKVPGRPVP